MKAIKNIKLMAVTLTLLTLTTASVFAREDSPSSLRNLRGSKEIQLEVVKWAGTVRCKGSCEMSQDKCELEFVKEDGEALPIADNLVLERKHCEKCRDLQVRIGAEKTPKFLFWGNVLKIRTFEVIKELSASNCSKVSENVKTIGQVSYRPSCY